VLQNVKERLNSKRRLRASREKVRQVVWKTFDLCDRDLGGGIRPGGEFFKEDRHVQKHDKEELSQREDVIEPPKEDGNARKKLEGDKKKRLVGGQKKKKKKNETSKIRKICNRAAALQTSDRSKGPRQQSPMGRGR